jgi:RNA recognition motif-containing protein
MDPRITMLASGAAAGLAIGYVVGRWSSSKRSVSATSQVNESGVEPGDGIELYVGNLSYDLSEKELTKAFSAYGKVLSVRIIKNKFNNRSKGYGFLEMATQPGSDKAVKAMHGKEVKGRKLVVNEARSRSRD